MMPKNVSSQVEISVVGILEAGMVQYKQGTPIILNIILKSKLDKSRYDDMTTQT